jgi:hypothetical protein
VRSSPSSSKLRICNSEVIASTPPRQHAVDDVPTGVTCLDDAIRLTEVERDICWSLHWSAKSPPLLRAAGRGQRADPPTTCAIKSPERFRRLPHSHVERRSRTIVRFG